MKTIILGGGLAGLSAASKLSENSMNVEIIEEQHCVGGLAASVKIDGNTFDYGPHAYHSNMPEILSKLKELSDKQFIQRGKNVRIKFKRKYYKYPLEATDIIFKLNPLLAAACLIDYILVNVKRYFMQNKPKSTEDWIVNGFGRTLYNIYFGPYTEKVWGIKPSQMSPLFAQHRIPHTSLLTVVAKSFLKGARKLTGREHRYSPLVIEFFYPKTGAGFIPNQIAKKIYSNNGLIYLNSKITELHLNNNKIISAVFETDGKIKEIKGDYFISTIPITALMSSIKPAPPDDLLSILAKMHYRAIIIVCLLINKPKIFDAEWIYFTNKIFNRLSDIKNCGAIDAIDNGKTGLMAEITCNFGDDIWNADKNFLCQKVIKELVEEGFIKQNEVLNCHILKVKNGYPIYDLDYEIRMEKITEYIKKIDNLIITGRQGLFKYVDMDVAMEMGESAARYILDKKSKSQITVVPFEEKLYA